jgi:hypothetical protein
MINNMTHEKKQNSFGKKLTTNEMKKLQGGWWGWYYGLQGTWVCPPDGYSCYAQRDECDSNCSGACSFYGYCP